ncbi:AMP-binding protein [Actinomadura sp. KC216]|uniref:AMP-binding protein n=1 Tax=Actinomadura sp. KC216 TaxID=2530370 RepID=UPI0014042AB2|nr:AMP-binding protein [Actinomadura sp. KC216]
MFEAQVGRTPAAPALTGSGTTLTYRELSGRADSFAHVLRNENGVRPGARVALLLDRSVEAVVGVWAVLKAAGAYVPLDPEHPTARLQETVDRAGASPPPAQRDVPRR